MKVRCAHDRIVPIEDLRPHPANANKHPKEQVERLAKILEYQGFRYPVKVSNLTGYVTAGHGRIEAARFNGWTEVPVNFQDYDDRDQEIADVHADNAIASWAELDLSIVNDQIKDFDPSFNIDMLGIKNFKIDPAELPTIENTSKELSADEFQNFAHECPKCGFQWDEKE